MFLRFYKRFILKKIVKKNFSNNEKQILEIKIKSVAILVNRIHFKAIDELMTLIEKERISQVKAFVFTRDKKAESTKNSIYFSSDDIESNGQLKNPDLLQQITYPYDLLINYYDEKNTELLYLSSISKAGFRVGFKQNHFGQNDFMIVVNSSEYKTLVSVFFKY